MTNPFKVMNSRKSKTGITTILAAAAVVSLATHAVAMPCILNSTETANPGDVVGLQGDGFGANAQIWYARVTGNETSLSPTTQLTALTRSDDFIAAVVPTSEQAGLYAFWVNDGSGWSNRVMVNQARAMTVEYDEVASGNVFRIWGRNLDVPGAATTVQFVDSTNSSNVFSATVNSGDLYGLNITAPAGLTPGVTYNLMLNNGWGNGTGGQYGQSQSDQSVKARTGGTDAFGLGTPWAADFTFYANEYNVKTDPRLAIHAVGDGVNNDQPAIQAAIDAAAAAGGGVVYLPAGSYKMTTWNTIYNGKSMLQLRSNVVIKGAGMDQTVLTYGYGQVTGFSANNGPTGFLGGNLNNNGGIEKVGIIGLTLVCANEDTDPSDGTFNAGGRIGFGNATPPKIVTNRVFLKDFKNDVSNKRADQVVVGGKNVLISDSVFAHTGTWDCPLRGDTNISYYAIRGCKFPQVGRRMSFNVKSHFVAENNHFTRDYDWISDGAFEQGDLDITGPAQDVILLDNLIDYSGDPRSFADNGLGNSGEALLSQGQPDFRDAGNIASATANTVTVSSKLPWTSTVVGQVLAVTQGAGAGQWAYITGFDDAAGTLTLDRNFAVIPDSTSKYVLSGFGATRWLVQGNNLSERPGGVIFYTGAWDVTVVENTFLNARASVYLRADQRIDFSNPDRGRRYDLVWNSYVADNHSTDTDGIYDAAIQVFKAQSFVNSSPSNQGFGIVNAVIRRNSIDGVAPAVPAIGSPYSGEYFNSSVETDINDPIGDETPGILGSIWQDNSATDVVNAYKLSTQCSQVIIWNSRNPNIVNNLVNDVTQTGGTQGSQGTVVGWGTDTAVPFVSLTATDGEANEAGDNGVFTFTRNGTSGNLVVHYTIGGTATNGGDYTTIPASVTIADGQSTATVTIQPIYDSLIEGDETIDLSLATNDNYYLAWPMRATVNLRDDDVPNITLTASTPNAYEAGRRNGVFTITRDKTVDNVTIYYTLSGTAANGTDYTTLPLSVFIPSGQASVTVQVQPVDDYLFEGDETVTLTMTADPRYRFTQADATVTIVENDLAVASYGISKEYVSAAQNMQRLTTGATGDYDGDGTSDDYRVLLSFSDTSPMSPASNYTGPVFYGGFQAVKYNSTTTQALTANINTTTGYDPVNLSWASGGASNYLYGVVLFETSSCHFNQASQIQLTRGNNFQNLTGRWVVRENGQYWVSQSSFTTVGGTAPGVTLTFATDNSDGYWAPYDPASNLNFDESQTFVEKNFSDVTAVGWVVDTVDVAATTRRCDLMQFKVLATTNPSGTPPSSIESWRQLNFGSPANTGDAEDLNDFDQDGIQNLLEFAFGLDPKQNSAGQIPTPQMTGSDFVIAFTQPAGVTGITYGAEWSETLAPGSWTAVPDTGNTAASPPQHIFRVFLGGKTKLFMRLRVTNTGS